MGPVVVNGLRTSAPTATPILSPWLITDLTGAMTVVNQTTLGQSLRLCSVTGCVFNSTRGPTRRESPPVSFSGADT